MKDEVIKIVLCVSCWLQKKECKIEEGHLMPDQDYPNYEKLEIILHWGAWS